MIRMVEISVLLGIKSHGPGLAKGRESGTKKGRACRASLEPKRQVTLARGWSLDQIPQPRKGSKGPINRHFLPPSLCELRRGKPGSTSGGLHLDGLPRRGAQSEGESQFYLSLTQIHASRRCRATNVMRQGLCPMFGRTRAAV